jgi:hypothetical protein
MDQVPKDPESLTQFWQSGNPVSQVLAADLQTFWASFYDGPFRHAVQQCIRVSLLQALQEQLPDCDVMALHWRCSLIRMALKTYPKQRPLWATNGSLQGKLFVITASIPMRYGQANDTLDLLKDKFREAFGWIEDKDKARLAPV